MASWAVGRSEQTWLFIVTLYFSLSTGPARRAFSLLAVACDLEVGEVLGEHRW